MAKRTSRYANMTASELAAETRRRGLTKPEGMTNISQWADFLEADDNKAAGIAPVVEVESKPAEETGETSTDEADEKPADETADKPSKSGKTPKGKE